MSRADPRPAVRGDISAEEAAHLILIFEKCAKALEARDLIAAWKLARIPLGSCLAKFCTIG
jgi:hypothetical protein